MEEERSAVAEGATVGDLGKEPHTGDLGPAAIGAAERIPELHAVLFLDFQLVGVDHHGERCVDVAVVVRFAQSLQRPLGVLDAIGPDKVPGTLWCQVRRDEERDWPDPLHCEGDLVTPLGRVVHQTLENTGRDELADAPAKVDVRCKISSDSQGRDFGGVTWARGRKYSPWDTTQKLAHKHDLDRGSEKHDEDEAGQENQGDHEHPTMTPFGGGPSVQQSANDVGESTKAVELLLPVGGDLVSAFLVEIFTVLDPERGISKEGAEQCHIIALHDDGS